MRLSFGDCVFDSDTREVFRAGRSVPISPKAFALLNLLIECRPKAVSKTGIHAHLWPDTFVSEANLANLVVELRAALGDSARKPRIIRTVARFGYAFSATAVPERGRDAGAREAGGVLVYRLVAAASLRNSPRPTCNRRSRPCSRASPYGQPRPKRSAAP